jgi:hypothetical protein
MLVCVKCRVMHVCFNEPLARLLDTSIVLIRHQLVCASRCRAASCAASQGLRSLFPVLDPLVPPINFDRGCIANLVGQLGPSVKRL